VDGGALALRAPEPRVREAAAEAVRFWGEPRAIPALLATLADAVPTGGQEAASTLGSLG